MEGAHRLLGLVLRRLRCVRAGIVGLPNVGKSSFFNILCNMAVPAENFPFCTIDPTTSTRLCNARVGVGCYHGIGTLRAAASDRNDGMRCVGRVAVPDERFDWLVNLYKPASVVPAYLSVTDIAGYAPL